MPLDYHTEMCDSQFMSHLHNIKRVFHQATADEIHHGLTWYQTAYEDAREMMPENPGVACGVIAALSPGMQWEFNLLAADALIKGESLIGYGVRWYANVRKAKRILKGEPVFGVLGGPKTRAFWACMMDRYTSQVCIDSHAYSIWLGERVSSEEVPTLVRRNRYETIARCYRAAARDAGIKPHQMQAVTWCTWRRLHAAELRLKGTPEAAPF